MRLALIEGFEAAQCSESALRRAKRNYDGEEELLPEPEGVVEGVVVVPEPDADESDDGLADEPESLELDSLEPEPEPEPDSLDVLDEEAAGTLAAFFEPPRLSVL